MDLIILRISNISGNLVSYIFGQIAGIILIIQPYYWQYCLIFGNIEEEILIFLTVVNVFTSTELEEDSLEAI